MKAEQKLWQLLKPNLPGRPFRIENVVGVGMSDVIGVMYIPYYLELKAPDEKCKNPFEPLALLKPSQRIWNNEAGPHQARIFILIRFQDDILVWKWADRDLYKKVLYLPKMGVSWNWPALREVLTNG